MAKILFVALLVGHGLIHALGFLEAFGIAEFPQLSAPISPTMGILWLVAMLLLLAAATTRYLAPHWFWAVGAVALVLSQTLIITAWGDARVGTAANAVLLVGVALGFVAYGPGSLRAEYDAAVRSSLDTRIDTRLVDESDLWPLPGAVQRYLRITGAVGQPQIANFKAVWRGRIRASATEPWMPFRAEQYNCFGELPVRLFFMDATMKHLPIDIFHRFTGNAATFRVRVLSVFTMVDAAGPEMNQGETLTLCNDLCILAPSRLIDPSIQWDEIDETHVRARYTRGAITVSAELVFDASGELVDFISDDRFAASADGKTFTRQRWRTPVRDYKRFGVRRVPRLGEARWIPSSGELTYVELELEELNYNIGPRSLAPVRDTAGQESELRTLRTNRSNITRS
ncbi:hypothetical protein BH11MYX2_BH11MYX2_10230 [soil metagenome]